MELFFWSIVMGILLAVPGLALIQIMGTKPQRQPTL